jgi:hypothetical protein
MLHTRRIETSFAAWSLAGGFLANFAGFILMGRLGWLLSIALIALGTNGLVSAMLLIAAADRNPNKTVPPSVTSTSS